MRKIIDIWLRINNLEEMRKFNKVEIFISLLSAVIGASVLALSMFLIWGVGIFIDVFHYNGQTTTPIGIMLSKLFCSFLAFAVFTFSTFPLQIFKEKYITKNRDLEQSH